MSHARPTRRPFAAQALIGALASTCSTLIGVGFTDAAPVLGARKLCVAVDEHRRPLIAIDPSS